MVEYFLPRVALGRGIFLYLRLCLLFNPFAVVTTCGMDDWLQNCIAMKSIFNFFFRYLYYNFFIIFYFSSQIIFHVKLDQLLHENLVELSRIILFEFILFK